MAGTSQFMIGTEASGSDGAVGKVSRVIVDPVAEGVTHLVVEPEHRRDPGRLVPLDTVPLGEVDVRRGDPVHATDGDIGRVQGLVIDPVSRHVTHVLLQEGYRRCG